MQDEARLDPLGHPVLPRSNRAHPAAVDTCLLNDITVVSLIVHGVLDVKLTIRGCYKAISP